MSYLLFFVFLVIFCLSLVKLPFFRESGIRNSSLIILFLIRVIFGVFTCYLAYQGVIFKDSLSFHNAGLNEYYQLTHNPLYFFEETFRDYGKNFSGILEVHNSFWNNLKTNLIVKSLGVLNIITFRNFYINTLIFNFGVFFGVVAIYRVFAEVFARKRILMATVFLMPTVLLFTTSIHRDGLILMLIGFILLIMQRIENEGANLKKVIVLLLCLLLVFFLRNYVAFVILPFLAAWWLADRIPRYAFAVFPVVLLLCVLLFFLTKEVIPMADFPQFVANRQAAFLSITLDSGSYLPIPVLKPDFAGFMSVLPRAISNGLLEPFIWKTHSVLYLPFAIETSLFVILTIWWFLKGKKSVPLVSAFLAFTSVIIIIMIGYTVSNLGAIVRYRSIFMEFIFLLLINSLANSYLNRRIK